MPITGLSPAKRCEARRTKPGATEAARSCRVELDRDRSAAGDDVSGVVAGLSAPATVALLRLERHPDRYRLFELDAARCSPPAGRFELAVPCAALPSTRGRRCALAYVVRARSGQHAASADVAVSATARPHLDADSWRSDRLLANWDARHFHIELFEARLQGGGRIAGRVHRHRHWAAGMIDVTARCLECWRVHTMASASAPHWRSASLWEQVHPLHIDPDATWAPFAFELPESLPPAVEAATIAWRYELFARRNVPHWFKETAAVTPLLYEHAASPS